LQHPSSELFAVLQIAWSEKAPSTVKSAGKADTILVHWFDNWEDVSKTPAK
jgi:hypothetical protein